MIERPKTNEVFRSVSFEFEAQEILNLQKRYSENLWYNFPPNDAGIKTVGTHCTHRHTNEHIIPMISLSYAGDKELFTEDRVISIATVRLLGWLADGQSNATFSRAELMSSELGGNGDVSRRDVTIEARVLEMEYNIAIKEIQQAQPQEF